MVTKEERKALHQREKRAHGARERVRTREALMAVKSPLCAEVEVLRGEAVCSGAVELPRFGGSLADAQARRVLARFGAVAAGGGAGRCRPRRVASPGRREALPEGGVLDPQGWSQFAVVDGSTRTGSAWRGFVVGDAPLHVLVAVALADASLVFCRERVRAGAYVAVDVRRAGGRPGVAAPASVNAFAHSMGAWLFTPALTAACGRSKALHLLTASATPCSLEAVLHALLGKVRQVMGDARADATRLVLVDGYAGAGVGVGAGMVAAALSEALPVRLHAGLAFDSDTAAATSLLAMWSATLAPDTRHPARLRGVPVVCRLDLCESDPSGALDALRGLRLGDPLPRRTTRRHSLVLLSRTARAMCLPRLRKPGLCWPAKQHTSVTRQSPQFLLVRTQSLGLFATMGGKIARG